MTVGLLYCISQYSTLKFQFILLCIYCMPLLRKRKWKRTRFCRPTILSFMSYHDLFRRFQRAIRTSISGSTITNSLEHFGFGGFLFPFFSCQELWEFPQYIWRSSDEGRPHYKYIPLQQTFKPEKSTLRALASALYKRIFFSPTDCIFSPDFNVS